MSKYPNDRITMSMVMEKSYTNVQKTHTEFPKLYKWVDDNAVNNCQNCNIQFSLTIRKHHCRSCGRIFCYKCSGYQSRIPIGFSGLRNHNNKSSANRSITSYSPYSLYNSISGLNNNNIRSVSSLDDMQIETPNTNVRVCKVCYNNINNYLAISQKMENDYRKFLLPYFDIVTLQKLKCINKSWNQIVGINLHKFREIQYVLPNHIFSQLEKDLLWSNHDLLIYHPKYFVQLLKSINHLSYAERENKLQKILDLIKSPPQSKHSCKNLMCTRYCTHSLGLDKEDALSLLNKTMIDPLIRDYAISCFSNLVIDELICYLPYLVVSMKYETLEKPIIGNFLINKCKQISDIETKFNFCNDLFWEFQINMANNNFKAVYKFFIDKLLFELPENITNRIQDGARFIKILESFKKLDIDEIKKKIAQMQTKQFVIPTNINYICKSICSDDFNIKHSASLPLIMSFICSNMNTKFFNIMSNIKYNVMFKFEDIRKDQIICNLIKLASLILKQENIDVDILTYRVRPTGFAHGFVELVPNSQTIRFIKEKMKFSILNYMMENNSSESIDQVRRRFLKSCAAYCVITYLFGIGDRHLENIMITRDGTLFHIDFSYILGCDPKPLTNPTMRISSDMIDALGGANSHYYIEFKQLCTEIFNALRKHVNLFITIMDMIADIYPDITHDKVYNELINRFIPGETTQQAEIQLESIIEHGSSCYKYAFIDFFHYYGNKKSVSSVYKSGLSVFGGVMKLFGR